jgi:hypothetical protein
MKLLHELVVISPAFLRDPAIQPCELVGGRIPTAWEVQAFTIRQC